jgi:hypothetical protein
MLAAWQQAELLTLPENQMMHAGQHTRTADDQLKDAARPASQALHDWQERTSQ